MGPLAVEQSVSGDSRCRAMWGLPLSTDVGLPAVERCSQWGLPLSSNVGPPAVERCGASRCRAMQQVESPAASGACRCRAMQLVVPLDVERCSKWGLSLSSNAASGASRCRTIWGLPLSSNVGPAAVERCSKWGLSLSSNAASGGSRCREIWHGIANPGPESGPGFLIFKVKTFP